MITGSESASWNAEDLDDCAAVGRTDAGWYCSGVLVHPRLVATVGHTGPLGNKPEPHIAVIRAADLQDISAAESIAGRFITHPGFKRRGYPVDLGVMALDRPSSVPPLPFATADEIADAREVIMVGFGCEHESSTPLPRRRRAILAPIRYFAPSAVEVPPLSAADAHFDPEVEFLAGIEDGGPCFGDSGGPAYILADGRRKLAGIISRPVSRQRPFCKGAMVLTRVDVFREWIERQA